MKMVTIDFNLWQNSPILSAAQEGQAGAVKYLMDNGAAVDIENSNEDGIMDIVFDTYNKEVAATIVMHERYRTLKRRNRSFDR